MTGIFQMEGYQTVNLHFFIRQNRVVELLVLQRPIHDLRTGLMSYDIGSVGRGVSGTVHFHDLFILTGRNVKTVEFFIKLIGRSQL